MDIRGSTMTMDWSQAKRSEAERISRLIKDDGNYRSAEQDRKRAEVEVRSGVFVNLADTVIPPTPEWLAKGETRSFTPKQPDDTVRVIKTVRRVINPIVRRMYEAGKLSDDHYAACMIYRDDWEAAGVEGRFKTSNFSLAGNVGGGGGMAQHPMAQHEFEVEARRLFREARAAITPFYLRFLDKVVLDDVPLSRAWRFAKCPRDKAESRFRLVVSELLVHYRSVRREGRADEQD